jgi:hypothetical protein
LLFGENYVNGDQRENMADRIFANAFFRCRTRCFGAMLNTFSNRYCELNNNKNSLDAMVLTAAPFRIALIVMGL